MTNEIETLAICCMCPTIRIKEGQNFVKGEVDEWVKVDRSYIECLGRRKRTIEFSHTYCPICFEKELANQGLN